MLETMKAMRHHTQNIAGFNGYLKIVLDGDTYTPFVIDISELGLSLLLEAHLNSLIGEGMLLENVEIYMNNVLQGTVSLEIKEKIKLFDKKKNYHLAVTEATNEQTAFKLWELIYQHNYAFNINTYGLDTKNLPKIPGRGLYTEQARQDRLAFIRDNTPAKMERVSDTSLDPRKLTSNIEAFIGSVEVPVGIAGPLWVNGMHARGFFYGPFATSEGALVASVSRGAMALTRSGGVTAHVLGQRMIRVPLFVFQDMRAGLFFSSWMRDHFHEIREITKKYSNFAELREIEPISIGRAVHVQFVYETGDASGQNMTTTCTWHACLWILEKMKFYPQIAIENFMIDGNMSNDKKVTFQSLIKGRGIKVMAETFIPDDVLESVLKVSPRQLYNAYRGGVLGSIQGGGIGMNVNVANVIGAMFTATGQDIACVHESSIAIFQMEYSADGVYANMTLPSLVIGTVGGGTNLPHQRECLEMIDCAGPGKAHKLAEIIVSYSLALDLSTLSAIASGQFASAHERLGRNRPVQFLKLEDLNQVFFTEVLRRRAGDDRLEVTKAVPVVFDNRGSSIITELTSQKSNKLMGHFPYRLEYVSGSGDAECAEVMVKVKPMDSEVIVMSNSIATMCDARLGAELKKLKGHFGFTDCHIRELAISDLRDVRIVKHMPRTYGVYRNDGREAYVIVQELLKDMELMDTSGDVSGWTREHLLRAIEGIAEVHAIWYGKGEELCKMEWIGYYPTAERMLEQARLWELLAAHGRNEFPEWFTDNDLERFNARLHQLSSWWGAIDQMPKTLIHNDFNPRNIAFRRTPDGPLLCAYDWELATVHLPQHDTVELLAFTLGENARRDDIAAFAEHHRTCLERFAGVTINRDEWWEGFRCCAWDLLTNRLAYYVMGHTVRHYEFMERVHHTFRNILSEIH